MAAVTLAYVLDELTEFNLVCWTVKNGKDLLAEQDNPDMSASDSAELLRRKVEGIREGRLTVNLSGVNRSNRKGADAYRIRTYQIENSTRQSLTSLGAHTPELEKYHHLVLEKEREIFNLKLQLEKANDIIDNLKAQIAENENSEDESEQGLFGISPAMISQATQLLSVISTMQGKPAAEINGLPDTLDKFQAVEPKAEQVLTAIIALAKYEPGSYNLYRNMLLAQAEKLIKKNGTI